MPSLASGSEPSAKQIYLTVLIAAVIAGVLWLVE